MGAISSSELSGSPNYETDRSEQKIGQIDDSSNTNVSLKPFQVEETFCSHAAATSSDEYEGEDIFVH